MAGDRIYMACMDCGGARERYVPQQREIFWSLSISKDMSRIF
jgi:hypothetical protein